MFFVFDELFFIVDKLLFCLKSAPRMSIDEISNDLRGAMGLTDLSLAQLSRRTGVSYNKLRRFLKENKSLVFVELSALSLELTGKALEVRPASR